MFIPRSALLRAVRFSLLCLLLLSMIAPAHSAVAQSDPIYLPIVTGQPPTVLYGTVTFQGKPAPGQYITLYRYSRTDSVLVETVRTDGKGVFRFVDPEPLLPDQWYGASYDNGRNGNEANEGLVGYCSTYSIDEFTQGAQTLLGEFDIAGFSQISPPNNAVAKFPVTLSWYQRPATPQDNYALSLYDWSDTSDDPTSVYFSNLGFVNNFTVAREHFPADTEFDGHQYRWYITVDWDSSYCGAYYSYAVYFNP